MNTSQNSNIYEINAASALRTYGTFVEGSPNCTLAVVSNHPLSEDARSALASSAERLGFGREGIFWVTCETVEGTVPDGAEVGADSSPDGRTASKGGLTAAQLQELLIACDPLAFVIADGQAANLMAQAFEASCILDSVGRIAGRNLVTFASFQDMLSTSEDKQRAWALLKRLV